MIMVFITSKIICRSGGLISFLLLSLILISGCTKDEVEEYSFTPEIALVNISSDTIRQYEDVLYLRIAYKDGNGDLGFESPDQYALHIRDIRLDAFDGFYLGPLAPPGAAVPIQGELTIEFPSLFLFGNGNTELTKFQIKLIDRAGNESNLVETDFVAIIRN
jgi:hypothetical protein